MAGGVELVFVCAAALLGAGAEVVAAGAGASAAAVVPAVLPASPASALAYQVFMPLWPWQAPRLVGLVQ